MNKLYVVSVVQQGGSPWRCVVWARDPAAAVADALELKSCPARKAEISCELINDTSALEPM